MAEVSVGDIVSRLILDASQFNQGIQQAIASMRQFQQAAQQQGSGLQQGFQQATQGTQQLTSSLTQLTQSFQQSTQAAQGFGSVWQNILQIAAGVGLATTIQGLTREVTHFLAESVQLAARMQDIQRSFVALEGSSAAAARTMQQLFDVAQRTGTNFQTSIEAFRRLEAATQGTGISHDETLRAMERMQGGFRVLGLSTDESRRAFLAWEQMLSRGRLTAEELNRQLANAVPGGLQRLAEGLGITTQQLRAMAESGVIPTTVAFTAFTQAMDRLRESGGAVEGITTSFNRFSNEIQVWTVGIGELVAKGLTPLLDKLTTILETLREIGKLTGIAEMLKSLPGLFVPSELNRGERSEPGVPPGGLPIAQSRYTDLITQEARRAGLDPGLLSQLIRAESSFNPNAVSRAGAIGLGQLMPGTAQQLQPGITMEQLRDPATNIRLAATYLAQQMEAFAGNINQVQLALAAYNAGPGRVNEALARAGRMGQPETFAGISPYLPQETQGYVGRVLDLGQGKATKDATEQTQAWVKTLQQADAQFETLKRQIEELQSSTRNYDNVLGSTIRQRLDELIQKYAQIQSYIVLFPRQAAELSPTIREEVDARTREAVMLRESIQTEAQRRDMLKSQVEQVESLVTRRRAEILTAREGALEAERFSRLETARLAEQRLRERPEIAGMTIPQQIQLYEQRLIELQNRLAVFNTQLQEQQAQARRPAIEAALQQAEDFLGRQSTDVAQRARDQIEQQGLNLRAQLNTLARELAQNPALQAFQERLQNILRDFGDQVGTQADIAYNRVNTRQQEQVRELGSQIDQIQQRIAGAALTPMEASLARIRREFDAMTSALLKLEEQLTEIRRVAPESTQRQIDAFLAQLKTVQQGMGRAEQDALLNARLRPEMEYLSTLQNRLEQLRTPQQQGFPFGPSRAEIELRQQAQTRLGEGRAATVSQREMEEQLLHQYHLQEQLNYAANLFQEFGTSVGNAWTQALMSIATGTQTVSEAFRQMAQSILQSLAQIAAQEGFKTLIQLGGTLIRAALGGGGGFAVPASSQAAGVPAGGFETTFRAGGGVVNRPEFTVLGERGTEAVVNRDQMAEIMSFARNAAPSAGGQAMGGQQGVSVILVDSRQQADQEAMRQRAMGNQVVIQEVLRDMSQGESSRINRMIRATQR